MAALAGWLSSVNRGEALPGVQEQRPEPLEGVATLEAAPAQCPEPLEGVATLEAAPAPRQRDLEGRVERLEELLAQERAQREADVQALQEALRASSAKVTPVPTGNESTAESVRLKVVRELLERRLEAVETTVVTLSSQPPEPVPTMKGHEEAGGELFQKQLEELRRTAGAFEQRLGTLQGDVQAMVDEKMRAMEDMLVDVVGVPSLGTPRTHAPRLVSRVDVLCSAGEPTQAPRLLSSTDAPPLATQPAPATPAAAPAAEEPGADSPAALEARREEARREARAVVQSEISAWRAEMQGLLGDVTQGREAAGPAEALGGQAEPISLSQAEPSEDRPSEVQALIEAQRAALEELRKEVEADRREREAQQQALEDRLKAMPAQSPRDDGFAPLQHGLEVSASQRYLHPEIRCSSPLRSIPNSARLMPGISRPMPTPGQRAPSPIRASLSATTQGLAALPEASLSLSESVRTLTVPDTSQALTPRGAATLASTPNAGSRALLTPGPPAGGRESRGSRALAETKESVASARDAGPAGTGPVAPSWSAISMAATATAAAAAAGYGDEWPPHGGSASVPQPQQLGSVSLPPGGPIHEATTCLRETTTVRRMAPAPSPRATARGISPGRPSWGAGSPGLPGAALCAPAVYVKPIAGLSLVGGGMHVLQQGAGKIQSATFHSARQAGPAGA